MNDFEPLIIGERMVHKLSMVNGVGFYVTSPDSESRKQDEEWWQDTLGNQGGLVQFQNVISGIQWLNMRHVLAVDSAFVTLERQQITGAMQRAGGFAQQSRIIMPAHVDHAKRGRV